MVKRIDKLTKKQEDAMKPHADKWIQIGLSCEPANFEEAEKAIRKCYIFSNLKEPKYFFRVSSPMAFSIIAPTLLTFTDSELAELPQALTLDHPKIAKEVKRPSVIDTIKEEWNKYIGGSLWSSWPAVESYYREVCGLELEGDLSQRGEAYSEIAKCIGWWYPADNFCVMCDRPEEIHMENRVLHSANGYAIKWRDGKGICVWRGTTIPESWMFDKTPSSRELLTWANIEQRRAGCEIVGWAEILKELDAVTIDKDPDPLIGELLEVNLPDSGRERFLKVQCGTGRTFCIPVPPDMKTALQANLRTYRIEDVSLVPEVRT